MAMKPQAGLTLIELVAAASLTALVLAMGLALYKDVAAAAHLARDTRDEAFQARATFASLCDNLLAGGGLLSLGPGHLRLLNAAGRKVDYAWSDSTFSVDGKPVDLRLASLDVVPVGPIRPPGEEWTRDRMEFAEADSLDDDRDGSIGFDELDRDGSGELEPWECAWVARITLRMETVRSGTVSTQSATVHPRNRAREWNGWSGESLGGLPGVGDFGR